MKKILIIGGGIAGLSLASQLEKQGKSVTLIERAKDWRQKGYVVGLWFNGFKSLERMGLKEDLNQIGWVNQYQNTVDDQGKPLRKVDFATLNQKYGLAVKFLKREWLHSILRKQIKDTKLVFSQNIDRIDIESQVDRAQVYFGNSMEIFDLVIDSSGIEGISRALIQKEESLFQHQSRFFAFLIENPPFEVPSGNIEMLGKGLFWGIYPFSKTGFGVYASLNHWTRLEEPVLALLKKRFSHFGGNVPQILGLLNEKSDIFTDQVKEVNLRRWHRNRLILIGDSAHAMLPTTGQGLSAALEDAYILSELLKESEQNVGVRFEAVRRKKIIPIQKKARITQFLMGNSNPFICYLRNQALKIYPEGATLGQFERFFDS